jgi:hypothetical protein
MAMVALDNIDAVLNGRPTRPCDGTLLKRPASLPQATRWTSMSSASRSGRISLPRKKLPRGAGEGVRSEVSTREHFVHLCSEQDRAPPRNIFHDRIVARTFAYQPTLLDAAAQNFSRKFRFKILPEPFFGSSFSLNSTCRGT